jgi:predicted MFS family arabinose efflux permease
MCGQVSRAAFVPLISIKILNAGRQPQIGVSRSRGLRRLPYITTRPLERSQSAPARPDAQVLTGIQLGFGGRARARALGLYSLVLSAGAVAGQSLGGLLISADVLGTTWRPAFLVNVPVGVVLGWPAWRYLPTASRRPQRLDLTGMAVFSATMLLLVLPLVLGQDADWPAWAWACLAASALGFAAFWKVERGVAARGGRPLVDIRLIARGAISWGLAAQAAATATYFATLFTLALYLQQGLGHGAAYSGLALVAWVVAFGIPGPVLGRSGARVRALAAPAGSVILATGFAAIAAVLYAGDTNGLVLTVLLGVAGLGLGTAFTGALSHLTSSVAREHAAGVSGLFNTTTRAGGVLGTAVFGTVYLAAVHTPGQATHGFAMVGLAMAATALAAAAMAWLSIRGRLAGTHQLIYVDLHGRGRSDQPGNLASLTFAADVDFHHRRPGRPDSRLPAPPERDHYPGHGARRTLRPGTVPGAAAPVHPVRTADPAGVPGAQRLLLPRRGAGHRLRACPGLHRPAREMKLPGLGNADLLTRVPDRTGC